MSDRRTNKTKEDTPIKAKAKHLKGKSYLATFEEKRKRPGTELVLTEQGSGASEVGLPFDSANDAAEFLGVSPSHFSNRRTNKTNPDTPIKAKAENLKGKSYRVTFDGAVPSANANRNYKPIKVDLKDLETGLDIPYNSLEDAGEFLGVDPSVLSNKKAKGSLVPIKATAKGIEGKSYIAIFKDVGIRKKPVTELVLTELGCGASEVELPFDSSEDAARFLGVTPSHFSNRRTNKTNPDRPIKAKAKHLKGKSYRVTFPTPQ